MPWPTIQVAGRRCSNPGWNSVLCQGTPCQRQSRSKTNNLHGVTTLRLTILAAVLAAVVAPQGASTTASPQRVLFIGNSLTYANDLPRMVERLSGGRIQSDAIAYPDFGLEEHWRQGDALKAIRRGGWMHVVLQQGPSSLPESRRILVQFARRFAREIEPTGAKIVMYGVWPDRSRRAFFDAASASYAAAASATGGAVVAAGDGWVAAWAEDASLPLYGPDGFHPSPMGTYLAALMLARHITGEALPAIAVPGVNADARQMKILDAAANASRAASR